MASGLRIVCRPLIAGDVLSDLASGTSTARATAWLRRSALYHVLPLGQQHPGRFRARQLPPEGRVATCLVAALAGARTIATARTTARERQRGLTPLPELHDAGMGMWCVQTRTVAQQAALIPLLQIAGRAVAGIELGRGVSARGRCWRHPVCSVGGRDHVLDEATCHLDPVADSRVERAFAQRPGTLVVVAHRISSALHARRVLVLDGSRTLLGTHQELLTCSALYRDLVGHWQPGLIPASRLRVAEAGMTESWSP